MTRPFCFTFQIIAWKYISAIGSLTEQYYQGTLHAAKGESSVIFTLICIGAVVTVAVISLLLVLHKFHTS